jgi:hypothetical protein
LVNNEEEEEETQYSDKSYLLKQLGKKQKLKLKGLDKDTEILEFEDEIDEEDTESYKNFKNDEEDEIFEDEDLEEETEEEMEVVKREKDIFDKLSKQHGYDYSKHFKEINYSNFIPFVTPLEFNKTDIKITNEDGEEVEEEADEEIMEILEGDVDGNDKFDDDFIKNLRGEDFVKKKKQNGNDEIDKNKNLTSEEKIYKKELNSKFSQVNIQINFFKAYKRI